VVLSSKVREDGSGCGGDWELTPSWAPVHDVWAPHAASFQSPFLSCHRQLALIKSFGRRPVLLQSAPSGCYQFDPLPSQSGSGVVAS